MSESTSTNQTTKPKPWTYRTAILGATVLAAGTSLALTAPDRTDNNHPAANPAPAQPEVKVDHATVDRGRTPAGSFAPIVKKVAPSVVEVFVTTKAPRGQQLSGANGGNGLDAFRRFFGQGGRGQQMPFGGSGNDENQDSEGGGRAPAQHGLGSGVIVSTDGYILTNNHVVKDASEIRVALADGREFPGKVVGTDPKTDVAVIKIQADGLPAMTFADSQETSVGDVVLAIGNPFGIGQTVTEGIVSAKDRVTDGGMDEDFIQTDAAINPGNSGGALVDVDGRLVGINTAILSHSGGSQGVGFAIPSNLCQWVMTSLVKNGRVERGFLGVNIQNITPALANDFKLDRINGALVADVTAEGPADQAGLKSGDVIRGFNGHDIKDASQLKLQVAETAPGTKASVQVVRDGQSKTLDVTLRPQPGQKLAANDRSDQGGGSHDEALAGVGVADLDANARAEANIPASVHGAVVSEVNPDSAAYEAGLRPGDVITEINRQPVRNAQDAVKETGKPTGSETLVKVWQKGGTRYLTVDESRVG